MKELFRGTMTHRELWVFIQYLPQDSWTQTILRDDPDRQELVNQGEPELKFGPWTHGDYQRVQILDAILHLEVTLANAFGAERQYPKPTPRPGMKRLAQQKFDSAEAEAARRYLQEFNRGKGAG